MNPSFSTSDGSACNPLWGARPEIAPSNQASKQGPAFTRHWLRVELLPPCMKQFLGSPHVGEPSLFRSGADCRKIDLLPRTSGQSDRAAMLECIQR